MKRQLVLALAALCLLSGSLAFGRDAKEVEEVQALYVPPRRETAKGLGLGIMACCTDEPVTCPGVKPFSKKP